MSHRANQRAVRASVIVSMLLLSASFSGCGQTKSAASLMADAQQYEAKGDNKAALIQLKNAAALAPADGELRNRLATLYLKTGDPVSAEKEVRRAMELQVDVASTLPLLARSLVRQGKGQDAVDAIGVDAKDSDILATLGDARLVLNDREKADVAYLAALVARPGNVEALIGRARVASMAGNTDEAIRLINQAIAANPKSADAFLFKGGVMRTHGKPEDALAAFTSAIAIKPDMGAAYLERANLNIAARKFDVAKADIDAARKITPDNLPLLYSQAVLDFALHNVSAANDNIQRVLSKAPDHMPSLLLAGALEVEMGSYKIAEQHLGIYLSANPGNVYARKLLAQAQLRMARPGSAGNTLAPVLISGSGDSQVMALAGESYLRSQDFSKASQYFEKAAVLRPEVATLRTSLGLAKLAAGDKEAAIAEMEKATALDPKSEKAGTALVRSELALKHYDKAIAAAKAVIAAHPDSAEMRNLEGGAYMSKGDLVSARASFEKAASLNPTLFGPVMNLAQLDVAERKTDMARKRLTAFTDKNRGTAAPVALAALALSQKNIPEATRWLEKAVADNPDDLQAAGQLINHYLQTNQAPKALNLARKLQAANPTQPGLLDALGQAQMAARDFDGALESYSKMSGILPKNAGVQLRLAAIHLQLKNDAAAADDLKKALLLDPANEHARYGQVEMAMAANKLEQALTLARAMQKALPKSPKGALIEGDILSAQRKFEAAAKAYEQSSALAPTTATLIKTASALSAAGKVKEAEAKITEWLISHPDDATASFYATQVQLARKDFKGASIRLEGLLKAAPNDPLLLNNLAWAYHQQNDPRALATAELALKAAPESAPVLDTLGWMLVEKGNSARALPLLQKAVNLQPNSRGVRYHMAVALAKTGDTESARKQVEQALAERGPFDQADEAKTFLKSL